METEFIAWLGDHLGDHPQLRVGPGDDAAVLALRHRSECVVSTDLLTDGVDFRLASTSPARVGRKALAVNLSDLAAMAARPVAAVVSLALPRQGALPLAVEIYTGMLPLAERFDVAIAGGDTNTWDGGLVISVTVIGQLTDRGALLRCGARPDDCILVTGDFGGSIRGKHFDFEPRVREALQLMAEYDLHAAIDVSDGLSLDLARLAEASKCGASLELDAVPVADAAYELASELSDGKSARDHALADGEDFELLLAVPPVEAERIVNDQPLDTTVTRVGTFIQEPGLWSVEVDGKRRPEKPRGFEH